MRYVPNLISKSSKVLPDYFKGHIYKPTKKNLIREIFFWIIGVLSFLGALIYIIHPLISLIFGLIGIILIPPGQEFIEKKLRFRLTPKIKTIFSTVLFIGSLPLSSHYSDVDKKLAFEQKLADEKAAKEKAISEKKEQQRKDSLSYYINLSNQFVEKHKLDKANQLLQNAMAFVSLPSDSERIEIKKKDIAYIKTFDLVKSGKYRIALSEINNLLNSDPENSKLIYNRAICYIKTGKIREAVEDLNPLIQSGNSEAEKLHNKINPLKKRVSYYITRCWDGSTSNATGRGACSHHGGVKNWNEPIYEEYRKYE